MREFNNNNTNNNWTVFSRTREVEYRTADKVSIYANYGVWKSSQSLKSNEEHNKSIKSVQDKSLAPIDRLSYNWIAWQLV